MLNQIIFHPNPFSRPPVIIEGRSTVLDIILGIPSHTYDTIGILTVGE